MRSTDLQQRIGRTTATYVVRLSDGDTVVGRRPAGVTGDLASGHGAVLRVILRLLCERAKSRTAPMRFSMAFVVDKNRSRLRDICGSLRAWTTLFDAYACHIVARTEARMY